MRWLLLAVVLCGCGKDEPPQPQGVFFTEQEAANARKYAEFYFATVAADEMTRLADEMKALPPEERAAAGAGVDRIFAEHNRRATDDQAAADQWFVEQVNGKSLQELNAWKPE